MALVTDISGEKKIVVGYGRHEKKYKFTASDIGKLIGKEKRTVQQYIKQKVFDPNNLESVVRFISSRLPVRF